MNKLSLLSKEELLREYRMKKLIRYNNRNRISDEDIAQHSYFVSLFCLKIMSEINLSPHTQRNILVKAILHDSAEIETSDLPHDVKKKFPKMNEILKEIEFKYYRSNWESYLSVLKNEQDIEEAIVKLADTYSVMQYCFNELELGNMSETIKTIFLDSEERANKYIDIINKILKERGEKDDKEPEWI